MRAFSSSELLSVWERGQAQPAMQRAMILLASAYPEASLDTLEDLSIGQRDASLLTLYEWTFGPQFIGLAICPGCGESLELSFGVSDIRAAPETEFNEGFSITVSDYEAQFRLVNNRDLNTILDAEDLDLARHTLLERCLLAVNYKGEELSIDQLPGEIAKKIVDRMEELDPQADVQLDLSCPWCSHHWELTFDIISFFWTEIDSWARRILYDVHSLARAYGWSEADILAMSPWRRQVYMEMANQ